MAISVGDYSFDERHTTARETYEAVGGKETRVVTITGLLRGAADRAALDGALDTIMQLASAEESVSVSVRSGRRILARRESFSREVNERTLTGQFVLTMRADEAFEESVVLHETAWSIGASGATLELSPGGSAASPAVISIDALGELVAPTLSDGTRTLTYEGVVPLGALFVVDGEAAQVWIDDEDVTPYTVGAFPELGPGATTLTYSDGATSSHLADGVVAYRDRWW